MSDDVVVHLIFGHKKLVQCQRLNADGSLDMGGYSIDYDRNGVEVSRTEPTYYSRITNYSECWPNGDPLGLVKRKPALWRRVIRAIAGDT